MAATMQDTDELERFLESISDAFFTVDVDWRFRLLNSEAERVLERHRSTLIGTTIWDAFPGAIGSEFETCYRRAVRENVPARFEALYPPLGRWFSVAAYPSTEGLTVYFQDVSHRRTLEDKLREKEQLLTFAGKSARLGGWRFDVGATSVAWSDEVCAIHEVPVGTSPPLEEAINWYAPVWRPVIQNHVRHCMEKGRGFDLDLQIITARGRVVWVRAMGEAVRDHTGAVVAIQGAFQDIDDRKSAEAELELLNAQYERANAELSTSLERYNALIETASDLIYWTDNDGYFTFMNAIVNERTGYPPDRLLTMRFTELVREDARAEAEAIHSAQLENETATTYRELPLIAADGREIWIGQNVQLLRKGGKVVGTQAVARDVTRQRQVERLKDEFLSVVSHELRTPLTSIRGSLGLLASGKMGSLEAGGQRMLAIASQNTDRLVRLINDLLDVDKLQSGKVELDLERISAAAMLRQSVEILQRMADDAGVAIVVDAVEIDLWADSDRMIQVVTNLLSNAIKFSSRGGSITLGAQFRHDEVLLWVRDEGRGIPADKIELVFERFEQVDSSDARKYGGTGLGLSIARGIVQQHGGTMWAESRLGHGSTFFFSLPARRHEALATTNG